MQIALAGQVLKLRDEIDVVMCVLGCYYQLPILAARALGKRVICASTGLDSLGAKVSYGNVVGALTSLMVRFNYRLSNVVIVESLRLAAYKDLAPFRSKVRNGALYLEDPDAFSIQARIQARDKLVGYIGRLVPEKGTLEFVHAIPLALEQCPDLRFTIIGSGTLDDAVEEALRGQPWASRVTWLRWVEHDRIPEHLNRLKLAVLPSYSEGVPNLALEAMGCGTPLLATPVGGLPDLVTHGETGFLLEDNAPAAIADAIVRAVRDPRLGPLTRHARARVEENYSFDAASRRYAALIRDAVR
jgi:glycosyltransferase involved in cell wall biosynthesis